jgi:hypothetical protein
VFLIEAVCRSDLVAIAPEWLAVRYADRADTFEPPIKIAGFDMAMVSHDRTNDHPALVARPARCILRGALALPTHKLEVTRKPLRGLRC